MQQLIFRRKIVLLLFVLSSFALAACRATAQTENSRAARAANHSANIGRNWQTVDLKECGVRFAVPPGWKPRIPLIPSVNRCESLWQPPNARGINEELSIYAETVNVELTVSLDRLVEMNYEADLKRLTDENTRLIEVKYLKPGGLRGEYFLARGSSENRILLGWLSFRDYRGEPQKLSFSFEGERKDSEIVLKILDTVRFDSAEN